MYNILHIYIVPVGNKFENSQGVKLMRIVTFSQARNSFKSVLDRVIEDADCTIITRRDSQDAVVMSLEYFNGLMETVHLLESPANAAHLQKSIDQYRAGEVTRHAIADES